MILDCPLSREVNFLFEVWGWLREGARSEENLLFRLKSFYS